MSKLSLKELTYSVLIVSVSETYNSVFAELLHDPKFTTIDYISSISLAKRRLAERQYDLVIINSPLPDDPGIGFAIDTCDSENTVVLLIVRSELYVDIYNKVIEHGVFILSKPTSKMILTTAIDWMISSRERLRKNEKKTISINEKMEEIRLVNRAKWILITQRDMDEAEAHRYIEKRAMDQCITKREVAKTVIKTYESAE